MKLQKKILMRDLMLAKKIYNDSKNEIQILIHDSCSKTKH
jgi:hypothetical protein